MLVSKPIQVKMYPIEDFTESVHFLKEVGDYLHDAIEARDKELQRIDIIFALNE